MKGISTYWFTLFLLLPAISLPCLAQFDAVKADSWASVQKNKSGTVTCLWYDIEPFIYRTADNKIIGVEYELMEGFKRYLQRHYAINLHISWVDAGSFEKIYPFIAGSDKKGLFGLSFYSITPGRKKEVKFSPPYMPDLNIICSNNNLPTYSNDTAFTNDMNKLTGYTMKQTTMEDDLLALKNNFYPALTIYNEADDYEVLRKISDLPNAFGYVPLSIYVVALQRDIKIKRQRVLATRREGFAAIYTKASDWDVPVNDYFTSVECKLLVDNLVKRYLGAEVSDIILDVSASDSINGRPADIELLTKEREIVTQRLIDTALKSQRQEQQGIFYISVIAALMVTGAALYNRFRVKHLLSRQLQEQNTLIASQKQKIELMNQQLEMKILQSRLNPHFLFNSLNAIQYFVTEGNNKVTLQYIHRFAVFLRNVLKMSDDIAIKVDEEVASLEQYLWLEQKRFPGKFNFSIHVADDAGGCQLPPLLSISLAENILYGSLFVTQAALPKNISISFSGQEDNLVIKITDNGTPLKDIDNHPEKISQRLMLMNAARRSSASLKYESAEHENISILQIGQHLYST